jgi:hypothetical protein
MPSLSSQHRAWRTTCTAKQAPGWHTVITGVLVMPALHVVPNESGFHEKLSARILGLSSADGGLVFTTVF